MLALAANGHAAAPNAFAWFNVGVQWIHLSSVAVWVGGLVWLAIALKARRGAELVTVVRRFSGLAGLTLGLVAATGAIRALDDMGGSIAWHALTASRYGVVLVIKIGLFGVLVALGARNRYHNVPRLTPKKGTVGSLRRTVLAEIVLAAAILLASGILTQLPPPATVTAAVPGPTGPNQETVAGTGAAGSVHVSLTVAPGEVGANRFDLRLTQASSGQSLTAVRVALQFSLPGRPEYGTPSLELRRGATGSWSARGTVLAYCGEWRVQAFVALSSGTLEIPLSVSARLSAAGLGSTVRT
jgi:uncharacterized membrane protein